MHSVALAATIDAALTAMLLGVAAYFFYWGVRLFRWSKKHTERWSNEIQFAILVLFFGLVIAAFGLGKGLLWVLDYVLL